jgi:pimeloyl-ACP methyl ester carboxylesterase
MSKRRKWVIYIVGAIALAVFIQLVRPFFSAEERKARTAMRKAILEEYPDTVKNLQAHFGLKPFTLSQAPEAGRASKSTVVLVHGLDDPGMVWMNLAPSLDRNGFGVWILTYPNDQPADDSARFFMEQLQTSELSKIDSISIVAHSMGGLVTREMLTDPGLAYRPKAHRGELPHIDQFIMVGTPNHGSELVRLRAFTEFRDQLVNLSNQDYHWLMGIMDGTGEAGIDLLPGSEFLQRLNSRPHPANVRMLVIAGVMSPKNEQEIIAMAHRLEQKLPAAAHNATRKLTDGLIAMAEQIGDGLVAVDSARLDGVSLKTVQGTHLSMIRNLTADSQRIPPAIPLIVEQLNTPPAADRRRRTTS